MKKVSFIFNDEKSIKDIEKVKEEIEKIAVFPFNYANDIISISLNKYLLVIVTEYSRYSYENINGVWGNKIELEI